MFWGRSTRKALFYFTGISKLPNKSIFLLRKSLKSKLIRQCFFSHNFCRRHIKLSIRHQPRDKLISFCWKLNFDCVGDDSDCFLSSRVAFLFGLIDDGTIKLLYFVLTEPQGQHLLKFLFTSNRWGLSRRPLPKATCHVGPLMSLIR